ncbi:MAG: NADH-quinone oxidoreductase subunit J [Anaerolineales bacterium]|nr:NADH-quinone oxidoreductase subunit J [Anaerolineales bacterium]
MSALEIIFLLSAGVTLIAALMVVTARNLVHSAWWLILTLFGVAVLFVLLNASFFAVIQVIIYIGAISILIIFAIMMTRRVTRDPGPKFNREWVLGAVIAFVLFGGLTWMLSTWDKFNQSPPAIPVDADPLRQLGQALVSPDAYVLPFELASILLLAALVGSIIIAWEKK